MAVTAGRQRPWHGTYRLAVDEARMWRIGPFTLWALRTANEWRLATIADSQATDDDSRVELPTSAEAPPVDSQLRRFGFTTSPEEIRLTPLLCDRAVVFSPESPFLLPTGEETTLYVSTPAWLCVEIGDPPINVLEEPLHRPTDTWFGPNTMRGELCYGVRTNARIRLESLPVRPHRLFSAVNIINRGTSHLSFERVKIPMPQLSVYGTPDGQLWTESITLERVHDEGDAKLRFGDGPPRQAADAELIHGPRHRAERGLLTSAFSGLIPWG
jgi:hypothetical protein